MQVFGHELARSYNQIVILNVILDFENMCQHRVPV